LTGDDIEVLMTEGLGTTTDIEPSGKLTTTWAAIKAD
jgi:hypothetical protein